MTRSRLLMTDDEMTREQVLIRALKRIEELSTDTPTPEDAERALDAIKRECEDALSFVDEE